MVAFHIQTINDAIPLIDEEFDLLDSRRPLNREFSDALAMELHDDEEWDSESKIQFS